MKAKISRKNLETWADYLLDHSLGGIIPEDVVMLKGEPITWPLMSVLQDKIFAAGAIADVFLAPPDNYRGRVWGASMARHGTVEQIWRVPPWLHDRYLAMNKYIEILGSEDPDLYGNLPGTTARAMFSADERFKNIRLSKTWALTLYPTRAFADLEDMSLEEYTELIVSASTLDPKILEEIEEEIFQLMEKSCLVKIHTFCPSKSRQLELRMDISERYAVKCTGKRNFPDGEVFTSPDANSVEGEIYVDLPVFYDGVTIHGIYLRFEKGIIKEYWAENGFEVLRNIIETDKGSHRLGEVALGMNSGIQKALKHPLFVEKIGGTLHIAIGASYPECYVKNPNSDQGQAEVEELAQQGILNKSAQHIDIVVDFRPGGCGRAVYLDEIKLDQKDNIWVTPK